MNLSVVVPTLNGREQLARTLDSLSTAEGVSEVIVVNGPSADGTTGMVRDREDVDVLVEIADRSINTARNAGLETATGDAIALLNHGLCVTDQWVSALETGLEDTSVVTGPTHQRVRVGKTTEQSETMTVSGREITYVNHGNMAFDRSIIEELDGFDEYLEVGGARDISHRLAGVNRGVAWQEEMAVEREMGADGGMAEEDWNWKYRSLAYRLAKNYGLRPTVLSRLLGHAGEDARDAFRDISSGDQKATAWLAGGRDVLHGMAVGLKDGVVARGRSQKRNRNPRGLSSRSDRTVEVYESR